MFVKSKLFHAGLAFAVVLSFGLVNNTNARRSIAIEEITVTAEEEESIFETSAIAAVDAAEIKAAGFKNILVQKTAQVSSSNQYDENGRVNTKVRGVTFDATSPPTYVISICRWLDRNFRTYGLPITQVERVEIIKGPQSTIWT